MRIQRLRLKNGYKRFHDLTIDLGESPARIVALVGPNGCGKSSVLDGMMFLQQAHYSVGSVHASDDSYHRMSPVQNVTYQDIEITFEGGQSFNDVLDYRFNLGAPNTIFSFRSPYRYNANLKIAEIQAISPIKDNNYGAGYTGGIDSKMEQNYRRLQGMVHRYMQDYDVKPSEARSKIIGDLNVSIKNCLDLQISNVGDVESGRGTLYFSKECQSHEFEFNVLSSGEKEVVDILLDLFLRKDDFNETVFLLDEPELHVNTSIQSKLLREIDRLVGEKCQIWITTHSIGFLRTIQTEMRDSCQVIQFRPDSKISLEPQIIQPMEGSSSNWRDLFEVALDDLVELVSPRTIIYCEGRDTPSNIGGERGTDAKVFNNIFSENMSEVLFVSSGGNTELDQRSQIAIAILGKVFPKVEILVFKDRDVNSGGVATETDRQVYLKNNPENHRVMKRFELENYLYDEEVLRAYCAANSQTFDELGYRELVTDISNQDLKSQTAKIKKICGISTSINPEIFKINLSKYVSKEMDVYQELEDCIFRRK